MHGSWRRDDAARGTRSCAPFVSAANAPSSRIQNIRSGSSSTLPSRPCRRRSTTRRQRCRRSTRSRISCAPRASRTRCRLRVERMASCGGLPDADLGGLSDARLRRDPAVRCDLGASDAADAVRPRRPRGVAPERKTGGGGAAISRAPRPGDRNVEHNERRRIGAWRSRMTARASACRVGKRTQTELEVSTPA